MIEDSQLDEWEKLADAATPGPWEVTEQVEGSRPAVGEVQDSDRVIYPVELVPADVMAARIEADEEFIAEARSAVPALIAEVRRLRQVCECGWKKDSGTNHYHDQRMGKEAMP